MNEPKDHPGPFERLQALHELIADEVEAFVDVLEALGGHRFDTDERAFDPRARHGLEKRRIFQIRN